MNEEKNFARMTDVEYMLDTKALALDHQSAGPAKNRTWNFKLYHCLDARSQ